MNPNLIAKNNPVTDVFVSFEIAPVARTYASSLNEYLYKNIDLFGDPGLALHVTNLVIHNKEYVDCIQVQFSSTALADRWSKHFADEIEREYLHWLSMMDGYESVCPAVHE